MSTERMRACVDALHARDWKRALPLLSQLSAECDRSGVLAQWLEVRPLLEAARELAAVAAVLAIDSHRADVAHAALAQLLDALGRDDEPRRQGIAHARAALAMCEAARAALDALPCPACGGRDPSHVCPVCDPQD